MRVVLLGICFVLASMLGYSSWREGRVVRSETFDGFNVRVREAPAIGGGVLSSPPGVADNAFTIEIGGSQPLSTYRLIPTSERILVSEIVQVGQPKEYTFQVKFSNGMRVNVQLGGGSNVKWFVPSP